jgi:YidC/Oxa1 family membrane protein insertase
MDRNLILAIVLSAAVLLIWELLILGPQREAMREARENAAPSAPAEGAEAGGAAEELLGGIRLSDDAAPVSVEEALSASEGRVPIKTSTVEGSINLRGGRFDDLKLTRYRQTLDDKADSPVVRLLSPDQTEHGHFVQQGWLVLGEEEASREWTAPDGAILTPATPVTLTRRSGDLVFEKKISIDENYMFTVEQSVTNEGDGDRLLRAFATVTQRNLPEEFRPFMILHEGPLGVIGQTLYERKYNTLKNNQTRKVEQSGVGGWVGITNKYWLAAAIPPSDVEIEAQLVNRGTSDKPIFEAFYLMPNETVGPGETIRHTSYIFGGPKNVDLLQSYEASPENGGLGVAHFDKAVDWGRFFFLTRPIFHTLNFFGDLTGNFGVAILILTLIVKALLFPLANKGYESMSKMKKLQPEIEKLRTSYADDKMKQQQEMMALYKKEKMNPLAGCLPLLFQFPIFYALYKTLFVTIEMRHEPFVFWIKDLSAPDPTTIFNLFGLLPYDPTVIPLIGGLLGIGVLPILMGVAMWFQFKLNPPPPDPVQAQIFALMPFVMVFIFAPFAAGLVLYWFWNTTLSILQQWLIMKRNGVEVNLSQNLKLPWVKKKTPAPGE